MKLLVVNKYQTTCSATISQRIKQTVVFQTLICYHQNKIAIGEQGIKELQKQTNEYLEKIIKQMESFQKL